MQILLKPDGQGSASGRLYYVVTAFLFIDVLNFLTFAVVAARGLSLGLTFPFPTWF